ncbi:gamma-glutamyltransferase [Egbenema bharatensis]|uniref:gamma-glutamyltransferase n=1 Tax=Egbenema bharatensis TaxID=3463334 RepID=UPI003A8C33D0
MALGTRGMVACPHQLASIAGLHTLQKGGNAVDAAISINSTLGVVYPHMTGAGGDSFWLIYDAKTQKVHGLNGSGRSAQSATCEFYRSQGLQAIPTRGPLAAITVPGTVDAWATAQARFGKLSLGAVLEPAIQYAESGYPVSASQVNWTRRNEALLTEYPFSQKAFLPKGIPEVGAVLTNPGFAHTLRSIARHGRDAFYQGEIAAEIVRSLKELGGILTQDDFTAHHSDWVEPITTTYRGYTICEMPPNTQGFSVLQMLNLLEGFDLQAIGHGTADYYHLMVEATKAAFADRDRWLTDPDFVQIPLDRLISKAYAEERRQQIDLTTASSYQPGAIGGDTTFSAVVDAEGNAVAMIQSLYFDYGCGIVAGETGVVLQNRGAFFSLDQTHANCLQPGKRTFHTLIPAMALNADGKPELVFGTMGGEGQPQTQVAMLTRVIDFGFDPQTAIDLPRWLYGRTWGAESSALSLEGRMDTGIAHALSHRGHPVKLINDWAEAMGHAHMIRIDPTTGILQGGSDPRSDGIAVGW